MVLLVPLVQGRAVRLTTRRLEAALPSSAAEIIAAKDLQRAEFALATRRLETKLDALRTKDAKQRAELGRKTDSVNRLRLEIEALHEELRRTEHNRLAQANEIRQLQRVVSENESTLVETRSALSRRIRCVARARAPDRGARLRKGAGGGQEPSRRNRNANKANTNSVLTAKVRIRPRSARVSGLIRLLSILN
jgi:septal ring factor EnvC (AmiA/AmiB activator)